MTDVERILRSVVDDYGPVRSVAVDDPDPVMMSTVNLFFEQGTVSITAVADDDSIAISRGDSTIGPLRDVSGMKPWSTLIGGCALWIWTMTNQQGFTDGIQFYVRTDSGHEIIQLIVIGSSLKIHRVLEEWG